MKSAVSASVKRSTFFRESLRRIQYVLADRPWSEVAENLSDFRNCLRISGYSEEEKFNGEQVREE